jgi:hypothetical protein
LVVVGLYAHHHHHHHHHHEHELARHLVGKEGHGHVKEAQVDVLALAPSVRPCDIAGKKRSQYGRSRIETWPAAHNRT